MSHTKFDRLRFANNPRNELTAQGWHSDMNDTALDRILSASTRRKTL